MSNLWTRVFALLLLIWLPLSFFVPPTLVIVAVRLFRHDGFGILGGLAALAIAIPTGIAILTLELKTLSHRPVKVVGTLLVVAYNTAVFL